jgi:hypothetical protein
MSAEPINHCAANFALGGQSRHVLVIIEHGKIIRTISSENLQALLAQAAREQIRGRQVSIRPEEEI